jgi:TolB-like protein
MPEVTKVQRILAELKRRNVFRVVAVYGAASFGVVQAADILVPRIGLPDAAITFVAVAALVGLPIAVFLAWEYERTTAGVKKTDRAAAGELEAIATAPVRSRWPVGLAALAGIALLVIGVWWVAGRDRRPGGEGYDSIAVLPFVNMTGDETNEYLGEGLAEELVNALAGIEGLSVASRTSAFAFKGSDLGATAIGDSLRVATVLEGSVRQSPTVLRVTAQLIDAKSGFHIWSATYDREPADLLDIQDELTERIVDALTLRLEPGESRLTAARGTENAEAYDLYLQGRYFWNKRTPEDLDVAVGLFEKAIAVDSGFAPAYAAIADSRVVPAAWMPGDPKTMLDEAERFARHALEIDPTLAQAHSSLGLTLMMRDLDFAAAESSFLRAIELDPRYATAHQWYAELLAATDRDEDAIREVRLAESLDPTMIIRWNVARILYFAGRYEEAITRAEAIEAEGGSYVRSAIGIRMQCYQLQGDYESFLEVLAMRPGGERLTRMLRDSLEVPGEGIPAKRAAAFIARQQEQALQRDPGNPRLLYSVARSSMLAGLDRWLSFLERLASDPDDVEVRVTWFNVLTDPAFDPVREDPRYLELNERFDPALRGFPPTPRDDEVE